MTENMKQLNSEQSKIDGFDCMSEWLTEIAMGERSPHNGKKPSSDTKDRTSSFGVDAPEKKRSRVPCLSNRNQTKSLGFSL